MEEAGEAAGGRPGGAMSSGIKPAISGVLESALYVADVDRSEEFYKGLLGLERIFGEGERMRALAVPGGQVLLLFRHGASADGSRTASGVIPGHDGQGKLHVAFGIGRDDAGPWEQRLRDAGVPLESKVTWPRGGTSLYFRDPDGHSIELVTPGCWSIY